MVCYSATSDWPNKFNNLCCSYNLSSLLSTQAYPGANKNTFFPFSIRYLGELAFLLLSQSSAFFLHLPLIFPGASSQSSLNDLSHRHFSNPTDIVYLTVRFSLDFSFNRNLNKNYNSSGWFNLWWIILSMDKDFFPLSVLLSFPLSPYAGCWWDSTPLPGT